MYSVSDATSGDEIWITPVDGSTVIQAGTVVGELPEVVKVIDSDPVIIHDRSGNKLPLLFSTKENGWSYVW